VIVNILPGGDRSAALPIFVGATLVATSAAVTVKVLGAAGRLSTPTGTLIQGAAILDDILALLILAAVSGLGPATILSWDLVGRTAANIVIFLAVALPLGLLLFPRLFRRDKPSELPFALCACFFYAAFASRLGLAPILGAYFAGLLIRDPDGHVRRRLEPIVDFLAPLFFVLIGAQIFLPNLSGAGWNALLSVALLTAVALAGKFLCALVAGRNVDRVAVGLGMSPRGEVGLIFAATGHALGVISDNVFAVLVFVVLISTLLPSWMLSVWVHRRT